MITKTHDKKKMIISSLLRASRIWLCGIAVSLTAASLALPWLVELLEHVRGNPIEYPPYLGLVLVLASTLLLASSLWWLAKMGVRKHGIVFLLSMCSVGTLAFIVLFDKNHTLMEEYSWIRYPTAGYLALAALSCAFLAYRSLRLATAKKIVGIFWILAGSAFLFGGLDELLLIHEAIGRWIEVAWSLPHWVSDLVTMAYAVIGCAVACIAYRPLRNFYRTTDSFPITVFWIGIMIYALSTMFDTVDIFFLQKIRSAANIAVVSHIVVPDALSAIMDPQLFFNSLEEVFEMTAAQLLFAGSLLTLLAQLPRYSLPLPRIRGLTIVPVSAWVACGLLVVLSTPTLAPKSLLLSGDGRADIVADYFDGLIHTDDLDFDPAWGVVVANEGGSSVYQWDRDRLQRIPDPDKVLRDPDSIAVTADAMYVSDGNSRAIRRYTRKGGWKTIFSDADGLKHPEGLTIVNNVIYVIDGKDIRKLQKGELSESWTPAHEQWQEPEGIAYDPEQKKFFITDDVTGAVFSGSFGGPVEKIAQFSHPEDIAFVPRSGSVLITDNGSGTIWEITKNGAISRRVRVRRPYRDLQGVTTLPNGDVYVISADGQGAKYFMPSTLIKITR